MNHNSSIECSVNECRFHCTDDDFCTRNTIHVQKHSSTAQTPECTDCGSFQKK